MIEFLAINVIRGKLKFSTIKNSPVYGVYADEVLEEIDARGYAIDKKGNCVPK